MKVLIVADVLGEENNGTTIACMNLIRYLMSQGDEVRILCSDQDKKNKAHYFVVPNMDLGFFINKILEKNNVRLAKPNDVVIKQALEGVDVVHVMIPLALGNRTARIARSQGIPVTAGFHAQAENISAHFGLMNNKTFNKVVYKTYYKKLYKYVNAIHYPTQFIRNVFEGVIKKKTNGYVISNGVNTLYKKEDVVREEPLDKKFNILFIGRLSREKCHAMLLKGVALSKYRDNIQLVFAGQGPKEKQVRKLAKKLNINEPIIKFYTRDELVKVINSCDLYVHPAEIEIEAISCLEAITCGLVPVIANSVRSATRFFALDDKNLFKYNSPQNLADKIDYWIENPKEKDEYSKKYLGFTTKFEQNECMSQMRKMLLTYAKPENRTTKKVYYYRDEINDDFADLGVENFGTPENFKYEHKNIFYKFFGWILYYVIAKPVVWLINKIKYGQKIIDCSTKKISKVEGCFVFANHTSDLGDAFTPNLLRAKRNYIITSPETVSIPGIRTIVSMLGAYPLPSGYEQSKRFIKGIDKIIKKGESIAVYPEAHIWPYYTKIRPFVDGSFKYPVKYNVPSYCLTNTYQSIKNKIKLVTYIDGPFYPNQSLNPLDARKALRDEIYNTMVKRAESVSQVEINKYINLNELESK